MGNIKELIKYRIQKGIQHFFCIKNKDEINVIENILIIRLDEIGDMVMMSPFFRELRHNYPKATITLITKPVVYNLVEKCPYIDKILVYNICTGRLLFFKRLINAWLFCKKNIIDKPDLAIVPRWESDGGIAAQVAFFSKAKKRVAYSELVNKEKAISDKGSDGFFTDVCYEMKFKHERERNIDILKFLGCKITSKALEIWFTKDDSDAIKRLFIHDKIKAIRLALFLSTSHKNKDFSVQKFAEIIEKVSRKHMIDVYIMGAKGNTTEVANQFLNIFPKAYNLVGKTTLRETAAFLSECHLYLGGDTGPMHIAAAANIKGIALFASSGVWQESGLNSPERVGPCSEKIVTFTPEEPMPGCESGCNKEYAHCINNIDTNKVIEALDALCYEIEQENSYD